MILLVTALFLSGKAMTTHLTPTGLDPDSAARDAITSQGSTERAARVLHRLPMSQRQEARRHVGDELAKALAVVIKHLKT